MQPITRYHRNGKTFYLVPETRKNEYIDYVRSVMTRLNAFYNIAVEPYSGKKYGSGYVWVIIG